MLPQTPERLRSIESLRRRADEIRGRALREPDAVAARAGRAPSEPAEHARLRRAAVHRLWTSCTATGASPTTTRSSPASAIQGQPVAVVGHQKGRDTKQKIFRNFGYARPGGLPQGAAGDGDGAEVRAARSSSSSTRPAAYPGRGVRRARRRRGDRLEPARDDDARGADHRHRLRRRGQRRRARDRDRRPRADAGVLGLQRHPARRLRRDPVARREPQGRSGRRR